MIMDERTNNLGVPEQMKVLELIRTLRDRGVPVILITHVLLDAFAVTDRVVVGHRGRKVAGKVTTRTNAEELAPHMVGARGGRADGVRRAIRTTQLPARRSHRRR